MAPVSAGFRWYSGAEADRSSPHRAEGEAVACRVFQARLAERPLSDDARSLHHHARFQNQNLYWRDVHLLRRSSTVRRSKTDAGLRSIPMNDDAYEAVLELYERAEAFKST